VNVAIRLHGNKANYFYPVAALIFIAILWLNFGTEAAGVYGVAAFLQASLFGYYEAKSST